jgi:hypothetical protein
METPFSIIIFFKIQLFFSKYIILFFHLIIKLFYKNRTAYIIAVCLPINYFQKNRGKMKLINENKINFGLFDYPLDEFNYKDYILTTPFNKKARGFKKRLNQFHFTGICGERFMIGIAIVDLKLITSGFFYIYDKKTNDLIDRSKIGFPSKRKRYIEKNPENTNSLFQSGKFNISFRGGDIKVADKGVEIELKLNQAKTPLRLCTRTGYKGWTYTQKELPLSIKMGSLKINNNSYTLKSPEYFALSDWTCGHMRRNTFWNWASSTCKLPCGRTFGLNLSCGVNETSFTENAFWIDGNMTKVDSVDFLFDKIGEKWLIQSYDKKVNLSFHPIHVRKDKLNALIFASNFSQISGIFNGTVRTESGKNIKIENCPGWTEDHYAKW